MADAMDTLKSILGPDAEDKIKTVLGSLSLPADEEEQTEKAPLSMPAVDADSLNQIMQIKNIMDSLKTDKDDPRANLLMSLKPYMRSERQKSIDSAIRLLGITNVTKVLKNL